METLYFPLKVPMLPLLCIAIGGIAVGVGISSLTPMVIKIVPTAKAAAEVAIDSV